MGYKEREIINNVLLEGTKKGRLFRVNCGMGWIGKIIKKAKNMITLKNPRPFHGMPKGTADVIGWESKTLCEIIVNESGEKELCLNKKECGNCLYNKKIAIFKAIEIKTGKQKLTTEQENWRNQLIKDGGIYEERRD